ncbi:DUF3231 family protein [Bacillus sp. FJAT-44742]|uniref:DUF3231 family protein n=1 Tax=Bacillus sp. FJAT-44742 TaxID=2014005 RepID=UPI000C23B827|nr:DUF3231 family protein [Bacillus sp. FJAT-44742]
MGILGGNPKDEPMHYGEIFSMWTYVAGIKGMVARYETFINHCGDNDLIDFLQDRIKQGKQEEEQLENMLKAEGIGLPPTPPTTPNANVEDIPVGAKFNEPEISANLAKDITAGLMACSQIMGESTREDIGMMFGQFHTAKAALGGRLLRMNKEKGWLVPPPLHVKTPEPVGV